MIVATLGFVIGLVCGAGIVFPIAYHYGMRERWRGMLKSRNGSPSILDLTQAQLRRRRRP